MTSKKNKRLLIISYGYAPTNMIGIMRVIKFVKFLSRWGWSSIVITPKKLPSYPTDPELLGEIPAGTKIIQTRSFEPQDIIRRLVGTGSSGSSATSVGTLATSSKIVQIAAAWYRALVNFLFVPDDMIVWKFLARLAVDKAIKKYRPDLIFSSAPPYTAHLLALAAAKKYHIPWVADFRDEWTANPFDRYPTAWHRRLNLKLERQVLRQATAITAVSEHMTSSFAELMPDRPSSDFFSVYNGYDPEDFTGQIKPAVDRCTIVYTGNFYGHRSPNTFLRAAMAFINNRTVDPSAFQIIFAGGNAFAIDPTIDMARLRPYLEFRPTMPHRQAITLMRSSTILLLVISTASGSASLTGKIFEYLASQRPILALVPEGAASRIIRQYGSGLVTSPDDVEGIFRSIDSLYVGWKNQTLARDFPCRPPVEFSREEQARRLIRIIEKIL